MCQAKEKKAMINTRTKINVIVIKAAVYNDTSRLSRTAVQINNILICQSEQEFDKDDIDEKYLDMKYADKLNVLITVLHSDRQKDNMFLNTLKKEKRVIEEQIQKKKQYSASKII